MSTCERHGDYSGALNSKCPVCAGRRRSAGRPLPKRRDPREPDDSWQRTPTGHKRYMPPAE